jgi:DNA-directed RNA polymerase
MVRVLQGHVMSWITPLGLPVMQPYRNTLPHSIKTPLQQITLALESDALPVSMGKQKTAFPPNYVHSLDSTHMFLTVLKMKELNIPYTAVHDSYWTYPCHIDVMNQVL